MANSNAVMEGVNDSIYDRRRCAHRSRLARALDAKRIGGRRHVVGRERKHRNIAGAWHGVVHERTGQELPAVGVVDRMLEQRLADSLYDSTMDLALEQERVNGVAEIVGSIWHLGIAFCFSEGILDLGDGLFRPAEIDCRR